MVFIHLYELIKDRGLTQRDLARRTGIREATISDMCNNQSIRINKNNLNAICEVLDCNIEDILEYIPDDKFMG